MALRCHAPQSEMSDSTMHALVHSVITAARELKIERLILAATLACPDPRSLFFVGLRGARFPRLVVQACANSNLPSPQNGNHATPLHKPLCLWPLD